MKIIKALDAIRMLSLELTFTTVLTSVFVYWCYCKWNRRHIDSLDRILKGPTTYPIIGSVLSLIGKDGHTSIMKNILKFTEEYGPGPFKIWIGSYFMVNIVRPEDIQIILNNSNALQKGVLYKFIKTAIGDGLITAEGEKWRKHHRLISPLFNKTITNTFLPIFNENTLILINDLKVELGKTHMFNLLDYVTEFVTRTICQTSFGCDFDEESDSFTISRDCLFKGSKLISSRMIKPWLYPDILFNIYLMITGQQNMFKIGLTFPKSTIKKTREKRLQMKISKMSSVTGDLEGNRITMLIDKLLELNENGADLTDEDLLSEVTTIILGATDTTSHSICFCLLMLAIHQDIQDKVYDEIYSIFGDDDRPMTLSDVTKLVYFKQVVNESLRLFSPVPITLRLLKDDVKIFSDDLVLPKGTTCILSTVGTHHLAELYPNPWTFNPENFNSENVAKRHKYGFFPFSGGLRKCIGYNYATLQLESIISTFLRNYSVHTEIGMSDVKYQFEILMNLEHGFPMTIRPRNRKPLQK